MSRRERHGGLFVTASCALALLLSGSARAGSIELCFTIFEPSSGLSTEVLDAVEDITLTVDDLGGGGSGRFLLANGASSNVKVLNFFLEEGLENVIENVAFDAASSVGTVNMSASGQKAPPGSSNLAPAWGNDQTFFTAKKSGSAANTLHGGETAAFSFDFLTGEVLADIEAIIINNNSDHNGRAAIHVGGFTGSPSSVSAVTNFKEGEGPGPTPVPSPVPLPAALWMGVVLLGGIGARTIGRARRSA